MMQRRTFLKMLALSGLAQVAPVGFISEAQAATPNRFWICLQAEGGWDPTNFCDPKPSENNGHNWYSAADIRTDLCRFPVAPYYASAAGDPAGDAVKWEAFWRNWGNKLVVINGIDQRTNGHDTGTRATWSGQQRSGLPSIGALIAGIVAPSASMAYIGNGGFNDAREIVAVSRINGSGDISNLQRIGNPNTPSMSNTAVTYQQAANWDLVRKTQSDRLENLMADDNQLPQNLTNMNLLYSVRNGTGNINTFLTELAKLPALTGYEVAGASRSNLRDQAKIALAAFKSGLSVAADIRVGGFDTHSDHNLNHYPMLANIFDVMNDIMTFSQTLGIQDKVNIVVGSEFGRTPGYNADGGKDHWPYNSMLFLGADFGPNARLGNVIGSSSSKQEALAIDPVTLMPVSSGGIKIRPEHVHLQLRKFAGISNATLAKRYGLGSTLEDIPLFSRV